MGEQRSWQRGILILTLGIALGVSNSAAADLEAVWEAQLRGRMQQAQRLLGPEQPLTAAHRLTAAILALEIGELDHARAVLEPLTANTGHPDYPGASLLLGLLHLADGRDAAARVAFASSLERSAGGPYAAAAHLALIRLDLYDGSLDAADVRLDRLAALGPSPELELASYLLDENLWPRMVRLFPSPIGLFAAARLSERVLLPPVISAQQRAAPNAVPAELRTGLQSLSSVPGTPRFTVRLGSFRESDNAQHMLRALRDDDIDARIEVAGVFSQVLVGTMSTLEQAQEVLERVRPLGYDGDIISFPSVTTR